MLDVVVAESQMSARRRPHADPERVWYADEVLHAPLTGRETDRSAGRRTVAAVAAAVLMGLLPQLI